jgi:hypothetical protein
MRLLAMSLTIAIIASAAIAGCKTACKQNNLPPAQMLAHPGPGVDGPGPGVMMYPNGGGAGGPGYANFNQTSQIRFGGPDGVAFNWDVNVPGTFDSEPLVAPGRYNFPQGAIYRLKMTKIPSRPSVELYPTLEVAPTLPRTEAFLAHNAIPVDFTEEDFDQVLTGNFVTKVIYLPDPAFQELALAGVETLVSTRLDPGVDPIVEAQRRGAILAIVRLGNKDLQVPNAQMQEGGVMQTGYQMPGGDYGQQGAPMAMGNPGMMSNKYIAGYNAPQYGMPMCGTPIGLPGPPSVPLGIPAGLQKQTIVNRTHVHMPEPTTSERIVVKQTPGYSYPAPADHVRIVERNCTNRPCADGNGGGQEVATGQPCVTGADPNASNCNVQ